MKSQTKKCRKGKKLVLFLLMMCMLITEGSISVLANEAPDTAAVDAEEDKTTADDAEEDKADAAEDSASLVAEVTNVNNTLISALSQSMEATLSIEREKLPKYSEEELMYLSCIIYCEAGNQEFEGKVAVANVIMNRAESDLFDHVNTIEEVIYDCARWGRQFSPAYKRDSNGKWTAKGTSLEKALTMYKTGEYPGDWQGKQMEDCIEAAKAALEGEVVLAKEYLYFNMGITNTAKKCKAQGNSYQVIGCHIFY